MDAGDYYSQVGGGFSRLLVLVERLRGRGMDFCGGRRLSFSLVIGALHISCDSFLVPDSANS